MNPRLVVILSFAFACTVIASAVVMRSLGLLPRGAPQVIAASPDLTSPVAQPDGAPAPRDPETLQSQTQSSQTQSSEAPTSEAPTSEARTSEAPPSAPQNPEPRPPEPQPQESARSEPAAAAQNPRQPEPQPPEATQGADQPFPAIASYELKLERDAARAVARDPKAFWIRQIVAKIEDKKIELSTPLEQPAVVMVDFVVGRDGTLVSKTVGKSSGLEEADKSAIGMLERAQPFPPMPEAMSDAEMAFSLPVRFH